MNYTDQLGTTLNEGFSRFSFRMNFDYTISNKLRFTTNFSYTNSYTEGNPDFALPGFSGRQNIRQIAYIKSPNMSVWEYDAKGNPTGEYFNPIETYQGRGDAFINPVSIANLGVNDKRGNQAQNNFTINYNVLDWLMFKETISFTYLNEKGNRFLPSSSIGADWLASSINVATENNALNTQWLSRSQFFITPFTQNRNHDLVSSLMWEMTQKQSERMLTETSKSGSKAITDPASGSPFYSISSKEAQYRLFGVLASINYKYKDRYILGMNFRADGSSAFGEANQWGLFPSISVGWRFSEEEFMKSLYFIDESKIRFSWGQSGSDIKSEYATYSYYTTTNRYMQNVAIIPQQMQLANLRWETVTSLDVGLELNLFESRVNITADVYDQVTEDLLMKNYDIPKSTGFSRLNWYNGATIRNAGWEYYMRGMLISRNDFDFSLNFNISKNINSFESFPANFTEERGTSIGNGEYPRKAEIGKPIGSFYGFKYLGVYPDDEAAIARDENGEQMNDSEGNPIYMSYQEAYIFKGGDAKYQDINHDGKIDLLDAVYIGDSSPEFIGGFGSTIKYKQISATIHFHYRLGFDIVNEVAIQTEGMLNKNNQSKAVLSRWKTEGQDYPGTLPRAYMDHPANNLGSDRYVEEGDFLRLNNVNITYRLNPKIAKRLKVTNMTIGLQGRNLYTFTKYSGQDPEVGRVEADDPFYIGRDNARTPPPKEYLVLFNIFF
ncbi:SusC/RagA family TonB-linked outer membrane protein [Bacteroidota bacterium]